MKKRILSIALCLCMVLTLLPTMALATDSWVYPTTAPTTTWTGSGTENDPYVITAAQQLADLSYLVNSGTNYANTYFQLTADINLNPGYTFSAEGTYTGGESPTQWVPIGKDANNNCFAGTFDGAGHTVSGVYMVYMNDTTGKIGGLFGCSKGSIQNVTISNSYIYAGYSGGVCSYNSGTITNCTNNGTVSNGSGLVGGVCGQNAGTITHCANNGAVSSTGNYVGGVCSYNSGTITNCVNSGAVTGKDEVGGVCGYNTGNSGTITACAASGKIIKNGSYGTYAGGVCGQNNNNGTIMGCYYHSGNYSGSAVGTGSGTVTNVAGRNDAAFTNGEVAWLLNTAGGTAANSKVWAQGSSAPQFANADESKVIYRALFQTADETQVSVTYGTSGTKLTVPTGYSPATGVMVPEKMAAEDSTYTVVPPVEITTQPTLDESTVAEGYTDPRDLTVTVKKADGVTAGISYQWKKDGTDITENATAATYTIPAGLPLGSYTYTCAVTCNGYTVTTNPVTFTVKQVEVASVKGADGSAIGTYDTIAEAITAAQLSANTGCTVTLEKNISTTETVTVTGGKFTIDLNGKTWESTRGFMPLRIEGNSDVTLKDGATGGKLISDIQDSVAVGDNTSTPRLTITGGTFTGISYTMSEGQTASQVSLQGGTFTDGVSIRAFGEPGETSSAPAVTEMLADGYGYKNNGVWVTDTTALAGSRLTGSVTVEKRSVASVKKADGSALGTYDTIAEAITAAQLPTNTGCTVTLEKNISTTETVTVAGGKFTIDLNGKTWSKTASGTALEITGGDVTLADSATGGKLTTNGYIPVNAKGSETVTPKLTITGGTYESTATSDTASLNIFYSTVTIIDGTFTDDISGACHTLNIEGGSFQSVSTDASSTTISGGSFASSVVLEGNVAISNGTFNIVSLYPAAISLTGGSYGTLRISADGKTLADALAAGYAYRSTESGNAWVSNAAVTELKNVTVAQVPSAPSGGGSSSSNTTTDKVTNPDGSTTTTTTNKTTGTVTETTKQPDGATIVVETKKDGTATTTDKAASGVTTVTKTDKNGAATGTTVTVPSTVKDPVKVDVPTNLGKQDGKVSAEITYKDGTKETVTGSYSGGKVNLTVNGSATIEILDDFVPLASALPFTDVPANAWYYDELLYAYNNGLFAGTSATTFAPNANMTRQQMWMVLSRMAGETPANMEEARVWAMENGVSDGSNPTSNVSRQQFVTLLWRFAGSPAATKDMSGYTDFDAVADYAKDAMRWAVENGIVSGTSATMLSPENGATRAQIAVILARYKLK